MNSHQFHVITGASGAGKSTLIAALDELGYSTIPEAALAIMREQLECNDKILPSVAYSRTWRLARNETLTSEAY